MRSFGGRLFAWIYCIVGDIYRLNGIYLECSAWSHSQTVSPHMRHSTVASTSIREAEVPLGEVVDTALCRRPILKTLLTLITPVSMGVNYFWMGFSWAMSEPIDTVFSYTSLSVYCTVQSHRVSWLDWHPNQGRTSHKQRNIKVGLTHLYKKWKYQTQCDPLWSCHPPHNLSWVEKVHLSRQHFNNGAAGDLSNWTHHFCWHLIPATTIFFTLNRVTEYRFSTNLGIIIQVWHPLFFIATDTVVYVKSLIVVNFTSLKNIYGKQSLIQDIQLDWNLWKNTKVFIR